MSEKDPKLEFKIKDILLRLRNLRSSGLEAEGEYSLENLAYKHLRNTGHIERLKQLLQTSTMGQLAMDLPINELNMHNNMETGKAQIKKFMLAMKNEGVETKQAFKLLMQQDIYDAMLIALENGQKIVVDVDDHFDALSKANRAHESSDPKLHPDLNRDIYKKIIMSATAVITSTPVLFDYYSKLRSNVFMVRNGIDSYRWTPKIHQSYGDTTIGWVGATHWRSNDLEQLADFFEKYIDNLEDFEYFEDQYQFGTVYLNYVEIYDYNKFQQFFLLIDSVES